MIVLDCSAAIAIVLGTEQGAAFTALTLAGEPVYSSALYPAEIASAMRKYVRAKLHTREQAELRARSAVALVDVFVPTTENYLEAFTEALKHDRSVYDMFYFTLARRNAATLFTLDEALIQLCEQEGVDCVHLVEQR